VRVEEPERDVERTVVMSPLPPAHESWLPSEHPLYRPRHSGRQRTALICAAIFFSVPLLLLVAGVRPTEIDNRRLVGFPSVTDGWGLFSGLQAWATDHLPLRGAGVRAADVISRGIFGEPAPAGGGSHPAQGPIASPAVKSSLTEAFPKVIEGKNGWLYLGADATGACAPEQSLDTVIARLQRLRQVVEGSGRQLVLVVAPNKSTMVPEQLPDDFAGRDCMQRASDEFWRRVVGEANAVDLRPALREAAHIRGGPIYSAFDTHWTFEGGMSLTQLTAESITPGISIGWKVTPGKMVRRSGDLPPLLGRRETFNLQTYDLAPDGRTVRSRTVADEFEPSLNSNVRESVRFNRSPAAGVVPRKVSMVADSFAQFATPYLAATFADLTLVQVEGVGADPKHTGALFAESDVLVVEVAERSLISGTSPILADGVIDAIGAELARRPLR
jgi:alginate O-acetyltransferase complex protein AlgJ